MADDEQLPATGRFQRLRKLASLSARVGTDVLSRGVKRLSGEAPPLISRGTAEKLAATLGELKGAAMKLGQMASMDSELLTPEVRAILARLQNQAPAMSFAQVRAVVERDFGKPPEQLFARFDPEPLAAASLGQVHRATLDDGREVAVKVQYPGIRDALASDLDNLGLLVRTLGRTSRLLDGAPYWQEFAHELSLELDYRQEAEHARAFAQAVSALGDLHVPDVVLERSTERVLTLEYLAGRTLKDFLAAEPTAPERYRVSRLLIRALYGPFLLHGEMHADPHPGNFVVMSDGRLGLLDFGSVKRFSKVFVDANRRLLKQALVQQEPDVLALSREVGVSIDLPDDEARTLIREVLHIAGRPMRADVYDYASCQMSRDAKRYFAQNATRMLRLRPPAETVMFFRAMGGLSQNLRLLGAKGPFRVAYEELAALVP